jgi:neutral amino acid transport system ATP-binding protein
MLHVADIKKYFGGVQAIGGSSFTVQTGKVTALIGPNGAGKTTLFDITTGFLAPDSGSITFDGKELIGLPAHTIARLGIRRTFQLPRLFKYLNILDHLSMADTDMDTKLFSNLFHSPTVDVDKYRDFFVPFGVDRPLDTIVSDLSYGQRKLLEIAMALVAPHQLLMFDEPVAGVNAVVQERVENILLSLKEKKETIVLIDHDMNFIRRLADHVVVLDAGIVIAQGAPEVVLRDERVLQAYLGV